MFSLNDKISIRQLQILLILDIFGAGVTTLPRNVAEIAGQDGWISVIIATIGICFSVFIITKLAGMFPDMTFVDYSSKILSRPMGLILSLLFVAKIVLNAAFELRFFGEIVRRNLLENTPFGVICGVMLILGAYAAARGYETRARVAEILIFVTILPLAFVLLSSISDVDFSNLRPMFAADGKELLAGGYTGLFAFAGMEFCLLIFPYLSSGTKPKKVRHGIIQTTVLIGIIMTLITVITIARFGAADLQRQMWPVLEMTDTVEVPGGFIDRQGALMMSFWIVSIFAIVNAGLFFSSILLRDVFKKGKHYYYIIALVPIIYLMSFIPKSVVEAYEYLSYLNATFGIAFFFVIPLILLIVAKIRAAVNKKGWVK